MKRFLLFLFAGLFVLTGITAAEASFTEQNGISTVRARAYDGLLEETYVALPEITSGTWSASISQPAVTATLPGFDNRVTYTVVYTLRT